MNVKSFLNNPTYHDKWFILFFIPFANTINYLLSYSFEKPLSRILLTYIIDTIQGYLVLLIIREIILLLDRKIGYFSNLAYRLTIQVATTSLFGLLFIIISTEFVAFIAQAPPIPLRFYTHIMPIFFIWILTINGVYVALYFYHHSLGYQEKIKLLEKAQFVSDTSNKDKIKENNETRLSVNIGKQQVFLNWEDIACFYVENELLLALNKEGKKYIIQQSLEKIEQMMDSGLFYRANRQIIINRDVVSRIVRQENGKLSIILIPIKDIPSPINISRTKAPAFKKWMT